MGNRYRHYETGDLYELIGEADDATNVPMYDIVAVYRRVKDGKLFVRDNHEFYENVDVGEGIDHIIVPRFDAVVATFTPEDGSAMFCEHANESPQGCPCPPSCYCKTHTCKRTEDDLPGSRK